MERRLQVRSRQDSRLVHAGMTDVGKKSAQRSKLGGIRPGATKGNDTTRAGFGLRLNYRNDLD
jgi:hypothetical protein